MNIDFVIIWVDGSDEQWIKEKIKYQINSAVPDEMVSDTAKCFRDWGILQYWFRGVEKFAPWVRKIHFVTWGHLPKWLNVNCDKLSIVNHKDFMPLESLPTFNSRALELNLHKIPDLAECFVYFNDDMFLIREVKEKNFFVDGMPCDCAVLSPVQPSRYGTGTIQVNNMEIINEYFHGFDAFRKNKSKWLNMKYGINLFRTFLFWPLRQMIGFYEPHLPVSFTKSTFNKIWNLEKEVLQNTSYSKFKKKDNVNQWLMRYWQLASGCFIPRSPSFGKYYDLSINAEAACSTIKNQKKHMICINDNGNIKNIDDIQGKLICAFDKILPEKSSFES